MPLPTMHSPNTGNYQVGKGIVSFQKEGTVGFRDMGNVESMVLTPKLSNLEHFSSRFGVKSKDLIIVLEKSAICKIVMDEVTAANIAIMVLGSYDEAAIGGPEVEIFNQNAINGWLKFVGQNDIGAKVTMDLYNVSFTPSGDFSLISDEWNKMEASAEVLAAGAGPNAGKFGLIKLTNVTLVS